MQIKGRVGFSGATVALAALGILATCATEAPTPRGQGGAGPVGGAVDTSVADTRGRDAGSQPASGADSGRAESAVDGPLVIEGSPWQAEDVALSGGVLVEQEHAGFEGSGYVNFPTSDGVLQWLVTVPVSGTYELAIRYALGAASTWDATLSVDGSEIAGGVTFVSTGAWTSWATAIAQVPLAAGENRISIASNGEDAVNIDQMVVRSPGEQTGDTDGGAADARAVDVATTDGGDPCGDDQCMGDETCSTCAADCGDCTGSPLRIPIAAGQPAMSGRGGIIVHDLDGDGRRDYILSSKENDWNAGRAAISAYDSSGKLMWLQEVDIQANGQAEDNGLPGWSGPGVTAGDIDGDGKAEIVYLDTQNRVVVRHGESGEIQRRIGPVALPAGASRWAHLQIVNLRGAGDRDLILQADPLPFRWIKAIRADTGASIWSFDSYVGCKHNGFRAADIDGDGRDEVVGATIIDDDGKLMNSWSYRKISGHFDSIFVYDVKPNVAGLEVVLLEESHKGDDRTALVNPDRVFWEASHKGWEPQNAAVGKFDVARSGLQVWNRSRFSEDQRPWVLDEDGKVIATWVMNEVKPEGWSNRGLETINVINWSGGAKHYLAAKERHVSGKIAIIDAINGKFIKWWQEQADRIYVVDVRGDAREEIVVVNNAAWEIRVYVNEAANAGAATPSPWAENYYRRQKLNYNYYSP